MTHTGIDQLQHDPMCDFTQERGVLPCSCSPDRGRGSRWFRVWHRWSLVRINPGWWARNREEPKWPIEIDGKHAWISGWDL